LESISRQKPGCLGKGNKRKPKRGKGVASKIKNGTCLPRKPRKGEKEHTNRKGEEKGLVSEIMS